ncbi:MAG: M20/M25/M40 family metallo-hydrolase [Anaerolineales bacterium]|nr:M20/M25/M40 family metallo-hydrolase [Anaerolineales bacterium]
MTTDLTTRLLDLACAIQQIPAPTFAEAQRAAFVRDQFSALGLANVEIDDLHNVFARRPGLGRAAPVLITAHTDTVFPAETPLTLVREAERISGPSIGDNSLGVAGLCGVLWALGDEPLPGDLYLAANVGEEGLGDLRGMRRVMDRLGGAVQATIVLEGMALGYIYHSAIGVRRLRLTAETEGGHSWLHFGRASAIHALVRLGAQIADLSVPTTPKTTFNIGTLTGGTSINTIARQASFDLDLRSESPATLAALVAQVEHLVARANSAEVRVTAAVIGDRPAGSLPREHPLVQAAARALEAAGLPNYSYETGSTDANVPLSRGLACVCVGLTRGGNSHRPDEYIDTRDVGRGLDSITRLVRAAYATAPGR